MRNTFHRISGRVCGRAVRRLARWRLGSLVILGLMLPAQALAVDGALYRSLAIPGTGQAHQGHMTKAALFAGAAVISAVGLTVSAIQYNQAVDRFRTEKRAFAALEDRLNAGQVVSIGEFNARFNAMQDAFTDADDRVLWRNAFFISLVSVYALNVADVLRNKPHDPNLALRYSIDATRERVLLTRSFGF